MSFFIFSREKMTERKKKHARWRKNNMRSHIACTRLAASVVWEV
jgi:hypothetical protein